MKKFFLLMITVIGIVCYSNSKKEHELILKPNKEIKLVKKTVKEYSFEVLKSEQIVNYFYENDLVSKIETKSKNGDLVEVDTIKYENRKIKEMIMNFPVLKNQYPALIKKVFNYKGDLIISINTDDSGRKVLEELTYNNLDQAVSAKLTEDDKIIAEKKYYYFENGNLSKQTYSSDISKSVFRYKSYDNRNNSFGLIFSDAFIKINIISKNNALLISDDGKKVSYEYEYNADNYPVKIIEKGVDGKKSVTTIEYE